MGYVSRLQQLFATAFIDVYCLKPAQAKPMFFNSTDLMGSSVSDAGRADRLIINRVTTLDKN